MRARTILHLTLTAGLAGGIAAIFVAPQIALLIATAAVIIPLVEALVPTPRAKASDGATLAAWDEDAAQDSTPAVPSIFVTGAPPDTDEKGPDVASELVTHLPELLTILDSLGRRAVETSDEASQKFITQLIAIENSISASNRTHATALSELEDLDRRSASHEADQEAFGLSIDAAVEFNNRISQEISASRGTLSEVGHSIHDLRKEISQIGKIAKEIDILSINAGIAAARAGQAGAGFTVIATSIRELASQTYNLTSRMEPLIRTAWDTISAYTLQVGDEEEEQVEPVEGLGQQGILLEVLRIKLSQMAEEHAELLGKNRQEIEAARARGADFERSIQGALASAQFGDIIRQQIETILNSLTSVRELAEAVDSDHAPARSAGQLVEDLTQSYVMDSQREAHHSTTESRLAAATAGGTIDLF